MFVLRFSQKTILLKAAFMMMVACGLPLDAKVTVDKLLLKAYSLSAKVRAEHHKIHLESLTFQMVSPRCDDMRDKNVIAVTKITTTNTGVRSARILLSEDLRRMESAVQVQTILHELAHAYDLQCSNGNMHDVRYVQNLYYYPAIKDDVQRYVDDLRDRLGWYEEILSYEWHAEWQSIQWMKKYAPDEIEKFKRHLRDRIAQEKRDYISSYHYPPATLLMQWISE